MVEFMSSEMKNNVRQSPEPEVTSLGISSFKEVEEDGSFRKRWKSSFSETTNQQWSLNDNEFPVPPSQYNPLSEPSPLGLRLRKSPSLLELAQIRLNQCNTDKGQTRTRTSTRASGSVDKLKASHFPALLLRIGQWEYVSKHEGDLVAKCYFSKHKIVWEVLDGGLKKKFEINWADIVALKANCPDNGLGTLTIMLNKRPLFFKEINPQPRKHTQWQATSDFTDGEASMHRQHFVQCAQGVLDKHYEKLIQCDTRLNFLSQQPYAVLDLPYFAAEASIKDPYKSQMSSIAHMASPATLQTYSSKTMEPGDLGVVHQDISTEPHSTNSVISTLAIEELGDNESYNLQRQNNIEQIKACRVQPVISMPDPVNHIGNSLSSQKTAGNLPFSGKEDPKDMLENISEILLSDSHLTAAASDEKTLMSRVNSLCCLLQDHQKVGNDNSAPGSSRTRDQVRNDGFTSGSNLIHENRTGEDDCVRLSRNVLQVRRDCRQYGNDDSAPGSSQMPFHDRNDGFTPGSSLIHENRTRERDHVRPSRNVLQVQYGNDNSAPGSSLMPVQDRNDGSTPGSNPTYGNVFPSRKLLQDHQNVQQDGNDSPALASNPTPQQGGNDDSTPGTQRYNLSRKDSFADLLHQLPRIASLSDFLFDISENGEILK